MWYVELESDIFLYRQTIHLLTLLHVYMLAGCQSTSIHIYSCILQFGMMHGENQTENICMGEDLICFKYVLDLASR